MTSTAMKPDSHSRSRTKTPGHGSNTIAAGMEAFAAMGRFTSLQPENADLGWGIVHLYRDGEETPELDEDTGKITSSGGSKKTKSSSTKHGRDQGLKDDDCTTLCVLAVPSYLTPSDFLGFVGEKTTNEVTHFRMIRTERVNRYMVLMKFRNPAKAREWRKEWNGKPFNSVEPEYCQVVFIKSIRFQTSSDGVDSSTYPNLKNDPLAPTSGTDSFRSTNSTVKHGRSALSTKPTAPPTPSLVELPTCPVCLERMDETTGLLTILCQHVFHCACLQKWRGSGCPVCRYTQESGVSVARKGHGEMEDQAEAVCSVCAADANLWACLICGNVGCGRYDEAHAFSHWQETGHSFAMDIDTQRVWDYDGDGYVHRLIQSKGDGKLVELPSALAGAHGGEAEPQEKVDDIGMEYTHLLTSQLESQRLYYEEKVAQAADKASQASRAAEESAAVASRMTEKLAQLETTCRSLQNEILPALERDKERAEQKKEKAAEMARGLQKEWKEEKAMNESLMTRIAHLDKEVERLKLANADLEEQNRDLTFFISGQAKLESLGDDVKEGTVTVAEAETSTGTKKKKKGKGKK
ncbi:MAG: hypothetical protein M1823_004011 [Watsoniomyces obsoletus]|nr:MAG: hypothetical protein M1823_004011 [Watsoniomyces obsoletus]